MWCLDLGGSEGCRRCNGDAACASKLHTLPDYVDSFTTKERKEHKENQDGGHGPPYLGAILYEVI